ncbi:MAG: ATP-binding protein [Lentimonas sp.]
MAIDLSAIKKTSGLKPPSMIVFGSAGVGKTTFAAAAPNPVFLQTEAGEGALELSAFPLIKTYDELIEAITALIEHEHDYETLVLDSLDHLEPLIWRKVCLVEGKKSIEEFGYGKGYVFALDYWREFLAAISSLRHHKNMSLILLAHTHIRAYNSPDTESYDRYEIKLHAKASGLIQESVDSVLFAKHKIITKKEDKGFNQTRVRGISTGERVLCTTETPGYIAKNRYGLPDEIDLTWAAFEQAITTATSKEK